MYNKSMIAVGPTPADYEEIDRYQRDRLKRELKEIESTRAHIRTSATIGDAYKSMVDSFKSPVPGGQPSVKYADMRKAGLLR
jgi:hypothetical protein